jgi:hypothetical protein
MAKAVLAPSFFIAIGDIRDTDSKHLEASVTGREIVIYQSLLTVMRGHT